MKSTTSELKVIEPKPFPKLMEAENGTIVLFQSKENGVCVCQKIDSLFVGEYHNCWDMGVFRDYNGSVTLSND